MVSWDLLAQNNAPNWYPCISVVQEATSKVSLRALGSAYIAFQESETERRELLVGTKDKNIVRPR